MFLRFQNAQLYNKSQTLHIISICIHVTFYFHYKQKSSITVNEQLLQAPNLTTVSSEVQ